MKEIDLGQEFTPRSSELDIRQDMSFDAGTLMVALEHGNPIPDILPAMSGQTRQRPTTTKLHREHQLEGIRQGEGRRGDG